MAWNRPDNNEKAQSASQRDKKSRPFVLVAGGVVGIGVAAVLLWTLPERETRKDTEPAKPSLIKAIEPAKRTNMVAQAEKPKAKSRTQLLWEKDPTIENGKVMRPPWEPNPHGMITGGVHRIKSDAEVAFTETSDRLIASLLTVEPGEGFIGGDGLWMFDNFEKRFLDSLKVPIIATAEDSEYIKSLKKQVNEARLELMDRHRAGEDITQIMKDTRKSLQELGLYRSEMDRMVREYAAKDAASEQDMRDYVEAANKLLDERGAKHLVYPEIMYRRFELRKQKAKQK